jgi:hypothetical protein
MVLDVRNLKLLDRYDHCEVRFKELLVNLQQVVLLIKFQVLKQLQDPFKLLPDILFWQSLIFVLFNLWFKLLLTFNLALFVLRNVIDILIIHVIIVLVFVDLFCFLLFF